MSLQRKKYTRSFKEQAIKMVREAGLSGCEVARRLNISESNIRRWMGVKPTPQSTITNEPEEIIQLRKAHKRVLMELEILKKAAAFFANECNKDTHLF